MSIPKLLLGIIIGTATFGLLLFVPAMTLRWWRGWVFVAVVFVATTATLASLLPGRQDLLRERMKPPIQKGQPLADKIILLLFLGSFYTLIAFIPVDVFRLHLLGGPGPLVSRLGLVLFVAGWVIVALALRENAFAVLVVKHQGERQQIVVDTGPYAIVRHPMYAGALLLLIGMPLWLGSYAAMLLASIPLAILVARILIEERFLRRELNGYVAYTERVRYRLIPFVW